MYGILVSMKSLKLPFIIALVAEIATALFLVWFYTRTGTSGLFKWNPQYGEQFHTAEFLLLVPPLFFGLAVLFYYISKRQQTVTIIFACLSILASFGCIGFSAWKLTVTAKAGHYVPKNHSVVKNMLPIQNAPVITHFAVSSDPHWNTTYCNPQSRTAIMEQVNSRKYDAFFILGDISDQGDIPNGYEVVVSDINKYLTETPVRLVMGNHDSLVDAKWIFQTYFNDGPKASPYYRIDSGSTHFIILNLLWGTEDFTAQQKNWLITQLESIPQSDTVIAMSHCFYVSSGYVEAETNAKWYDIPQMIKEVCPIFEKYHVDLVLSGHNHLMNVLKKDGITYAICGAMGGPLDDRTDYNSPYSIWEENTKNGWLDVTVGKNDIQLVYFDSDGNELYRDSVTLSK